MNLRLVIFSVIFCSAFAHADSATKPATEIGSSIEIDEWKCTIREDEGLRGRGIRCDNTSEYCVKLFERTKAWHEKIFGCGVKGHKNYPCDWNDKDPMSIDTTEHDGPPANEFATRRYNYDRCGPHGVGAFVIDR